jgi:hypothetical protein
MADDPLGAILPFERFRLAAAAFALLPDSKYTRRFFTLMSEWEDRPRPNPLAAVLIASTLGGADSTALGGWMLPRGIPPLVI